MFFGIEPISLPTLALLVGFGSCDAKPPPEIYVNLNFGRVKYDLSKSYRQLENFDISTISPYAAHEHTRVSGLTGGKIKVQSNINIAWSTSSFTQRNCLWFDDIVIDVDLESVIYIAKENRKGSCSYTQVKNHEWKHVKTDRAVLEEYKPALEKAARSAVRKVGVVGPISGDDNLEMRKKMARAVEVALERVADTMNSERAKRQQLIDSRKEYDRLSNACKKKPPLK